MLKALLSSSFLATWTAHLNHIDLITLTVFGELYKLWSSSLWSFRADVAKTRRNSQQELWNFAKYETHFEIPKDKFSTLRHNISSWGVKRIVQTLWELEKDFMKWACKLNNIQNDIVLYKGDIKFSLWMIVENLADPFPSYEYKVSWICWSDPGTWRIWFRQLWLSRVYWNVMEEDIQSARGSETGIHVWPTWQNLALTTLGPVGRSKSAESVITHTHTPVRPQVFSCAGLWPPELFNLNFSAKSATCFQLFPLTFK